MLNRSRLKAIVLQYCPNLSNLTLGYTPSTKKLATTKESADLVLDESDDSDWESISDEDTDSDSDIVEYIEEKCYFMRFGDISRPLPDEKWEAVKEIAPTTNIHTIRISDEFVINVVDSMIYLRFVQSLFERVILASKRLHSNRSALIF